MESNETLTYGKQVVEILGKPIVTNTVLAILLILVGLIIARALSKIIEKILSEIELNRILETATGIKFDLTKMTKSFVFYFIAFVSFIMALNAIGITTTVLQFIAGAIIILVVVSVILGVKDFIPNLIASANIQRRKTIKVGMRIRVNDVTGKVAAININETKIVTKSGDEILIPNSSLIKSKIVKLKK